MKAVALDLEGPLSPQDNAYEVAGLLDRGRELFERISRYDDQLAVLGTAGYEAGDTLALIAPFLVAEGITEDDIRGITETADIVNGAPELVEHLRRDLDVYIISTSYRAHASRVAEKVGVKQENVRCTPLDLEALRSGLDDDFFDLIEERKADVLDGDKDLLDHFFFTELPETSYGDPFQRVRVVGGARKADALRAIVRDHDIEIRDTLAVGDSITDREMLTLVREEGGISIVFNGNEYALPCGDFGIASTDLRLVRLFTDLDDPVTIARQWQERRDAFEADPASIPDHLVPDDLRDLLTDLHPFPSIQYLGDGHEEHESVHAAFRELLRGEAAKLG